MAQNLSIPGYFKQLDQDIIDASRFFKKNTRWKASNDKLVLVALRLFSSMTMAVSICSSTLVILNPYNSLWGGALKLAFCVSSYVLGHDLFTIAKNISNDSLNLQNIKFEISTEERTKQNFLSNGTVISSWNDLIVYQEKIEGTN